MNFPEALFDVEDVEVHLDTTEDGDLCDSSELHSLFSVPYYLEREVSLSMEKTYILSLDWSEVESGRKLVASLSDNTSVVYDLETFSKISTIHGHTETITGVKFNLQHEHLVYSSSTDGTIKLWDLRSDVKCVKTFQDATAEDKLKPLLCFDVAPTDRFIVAGSELFEGDAYLLFWDTRSSNLLGGYWESHTDDITQVSFHSSKEDWIASGSTDGLINVFDVSKDCEDNALLYSLNSETSVQKLHWFTLAGDHDGLSAISHMNSLQLWKTDEASPFVDFARDNITEALQRKSADHCYLVSTHETSVNGELLLIAGSTSGRGECLRLLKIQKRKLKQFSILPDNKQIVRASLYDDKNKYIITGGESGLLSMWKQGTKSMESISSTLKVRHKDVKIHKSKSVY